MYLNYSNVLTINNKILIAFFMLFIGLGSMSVYSQSCNSDLSVKKNRNTKSSIEDESVLRTVSNKIPLVLLPTVIIDVSSFENFKNYRYE